MENEIIARILFTAFMAGYLLSTGIGTATAVNVFLLKLLKKWRNKK